MRGSEKINPSKYIKEATLDVLSGVAFLRYNSINEVKLWD